MEGDMISVVGYEVSPIEVEEGLLLHPAIQERSPSPPTRATSSFAPRSIPSPR